MWYEIIPAAFLTGLVAIVPPTAVYYINQFVLGNPMRRNLNERWDRQMFMRDGRTDGAPWKNKGLDNVPDE